MSFLLRFDAVFTGSDIHVTVTYLSDTFPEYLLIFLFSIFNVLSKKLKTFLPKLCSNILHFFN